MKDASTSIWDNRELVIFDVDGTLYSQPRLRARMAMSLLAEAIRSGSFETMRILRQYRLHREILADASPGDFVERQFTDTAAACTCSRDSVQEIVAEWIERRPLRHLAACRYAGLEAVFEGLRRSGRAIAVLSDYAAHQKLGVLGLQADFIVSATDEDVQSLKPDPKGLQKILRLAGVSSGRALMVGDRFDRDWTAASRVGMDTIIRCSRADQRCVTFRSYHDALFAPVLRSSPVAGRMPVGAKS